MPHQLFSCWLVSICEENTVLLLTVIQCGEPVITCDHSTTMLLFFNVYVATKHNQAPILLDIMSLVQASAHLLYKRFFFFCPFRTWRTQWSRDTTSLCYLLLLMLTSTLNITVRVSIPLLFVFYSGQSEKHLLYFILSKSFRKASTAQLTAY